MKGYILPLLLIINFTIGCNKEDKTSQVIEVLDGQQITVDSFNTAYETAIESLSRMQNLEKKNLREFISKDINEVPDEFKQLNQQFQKKNFYDNYRQMMMIKIVADKNGFTSRSDIKEILKQVEMQTISTLYLQEQVENKIKITDEQAMAECEKLRQGDKRFAAMTIDKCVMIGRGYLKRNESEKILPKVMERIKENISIKHNEKFDLDEYLKNNDGKSSLTKFQPNSQVLVTAKDGISLKKEASMSAENIDTLPADTKVTIKSTGEKSEKIQNEESYWYSVEYKGKTGWIFSGSLKKVE